jgi:hypothetical protein
MYARLDIGIRILAIGCIFESFPSHTSLNQARVCRYAIAIPSELAPAAITRSQSGVDVYVAFVHHQRRANVTPPKIEDDPNLL